MKEQDKILNYIYTRDQNSKKREMILSQLLRGNGEEIKKRLPNKQNTALTL